MLYLVGSLLAGAACPALLQFKPVPRWWRIVGHVHVFINTNRHQFVCTNVLLFFKTLEFVAVLKVARQKYVCHLIHSEDVEVEAKANSQINSWMKNDGQKKSETYV